ANGGAILADNPNNSLALDSVMIIGNSAQELAGGGGAEAPPPTSPGGLTEQGNVVEFARQIRLGRGGIPVALGKADQLAARVFDDKAEPTSVRRLKRLSPLVLADLVAWPVPEHGRMCLIERRHVQASESGEVCQRRFPNRNGGLHRVPIPL